jgi:hypothetical protein
MEKEVSKELIRKLLRNIESETFDQRKAIFNQGIPVVRKGVKRHAKIYLWF